MNHRRSMKLTLPAGCHYNPNWLVITFLIRKLKSRLFEAVYGIARDGYVVYAVMSEPSPKRVRFDNEGTPRCSSICARLCLEDLLLKLGCRFFFDCVSLFVYYLAFLFFSC